MAKRKVVSTPEQVVNQDETLVDLGGVQQQAQTLWAQYGKMITYVGGGILALAIGYFAYKFLYAAPRQAEAEKEMFTAELLLGQDNYKAALEGDSTGVKGFTAIMNDYSGTPAANLSKYYAGVCNLNLGNFEQAVQNLEDYNGNGVGCIMKHGALGDAYSELNNFDKAASNYDDAIDAGDDEVLTPYYMKKMAVLVMTGKAKGDAKKLWETMREKYPRSPEAAEAEKMLARF